MQVACEPAAVEEGKVWTIIEPQVESMIRRL